jgi:hypothetical protein
MPVRPAARPSSRALVVLLALLAALAFPATAPALKLEIVNESGEAAEDVFITVAGEAGTYDVPGMENDVPKPLDEIGGGELAIERLISGRVYVSYGAGVDVGVPFDSPTRFDWAELTVTPSVNDVANLTAVDQVGIGMRLDTLDAGDAILETVGSANSDTVFAALQEIPGGPQATMRDGDGNIIRVLSPLHSDAYPDLGDYVRSLAGQTITLHAQFDAVSTHYSGTFGADGSIVLHGETSPPGQAPAEIPIPGAELIEDIYPAANTPNNPYGEIRHDLLAGFSTGLWGGRYGNDAIAFCTNPQIYAPTGWPICPTGFNQPSFGDARSGPSPFATCEQYAAVINKHTDIYGNPYSDASKRVTVGLDQPGDGGAVETLRLTILPDSGDAGPVTGGNADCGATPPTPPAPASGGSSAQAAPIAAAAPKPRPGKRPCARPGKKKGKKHAAKRGTKARPGKHHGKGKRGKRCPRPAKKHRRGRHAH